MEIVDFQKPQSDQHWVTPAYGRAGPLPQGWFTRTVPAMPHAPYRYADDVPVTSIGAVLIRPRGQEVPQRALGNLPLGQGMPALAGDPRLKVNTLVKNKLVAQPTLQHRALRGLSGPFDGAAAGGSVQERGKWGDDHPIQATFARDTVQLAKEQPWLTAFLVGAGTLVFISLFRAFGKVEG